MFRSPWPTIGIMLVLAGTSAGQTLPETVPVENPTALLANVGMIQGTLSELGASLPSASLAAIRSAIKGMEGESLQEAVDPHVLLVVTLNPEGRVKVSRGPKKLILTQNMPGYAILKVVNQSGGQQRLRTLSSYTGSIRSPFQVAFWDQGKYRSDLSGELVEYRLLRISCDDVGKRELTIGFDAGQGTQDLGFRGETPVLFEVHSKQ